MASKNASGAYLRDARLSMGLTREQAAARIGVSVSTLGRYERHGLDRRTRISRVAGVAKAYGIDLEELNGVIRNETGAFLRARREELGLSGVEMAERLGWGVGSVIDLEWDGIGGDCPYDRLREVCVAYRVSSDDLLRRMA